MGVPTMAQAKTFVALDVHVSATVRGDHRSRFGRAAVQRLSGRGSEVCEFVAALPGPVRATYEAGPTGFGLARRLAGRGRRLLGVRAGVDSARAVRIASRPISATPSGWCGC